eukprot:g21767.t1
MLTLCDALVGVDPDSFCQYGGFTICLTPKQVLLTPPGIVLIEVPLSEANFSVHWHYMVPSHLRGSADERLKEQVDYAEQVTFFDLKKADDENTSLSQVTFLQKVSAELDVAQSLLLWLSKLAKARYTVRGLVGLEFDFVWPFDEFQGDLDALVQEAVDKKCKLGKRIGRIHEELVKAEKDSKREVRCTDVKSFHRLSAVDQDPLLKILQPSIKFEEVDRLDEVDTVPTSILVNDALDILSAFMQRCADHKASEKKEDTKKSKESQQQQQQQPQQQNQATSELTPAQLLQPGVPSVKAIQPADAAASTGDVAENKNLNCAGKTDGANASGKQQTEPAEEETHDHEDEHTSAKQQQQQQQQQLEQAQTQGQPKPQEAPSPPAAAAELPEAQQQEKTASPPGPELQKKQPENPAPEDTTEENRNPEPVETLEMALEALMDEHDETDALEAEGMKIPEASGDPDGFWILMLQGVGVDSRVFFLFAIIVVVVYHIILIVLWTAPMSTRMQKQFFLTAQVLNAWSGLDVFCVTILAGVLEIRQFADFIVGNKCDSLDQMLAKSPLADEMPGGVMTCFDVDSTLRAGFIVLAVAVVISTITGQIMLAKCSDRLCDARRADGAGAEAA